MRLSIRLERSDPRLGAQRGSNSASVPICAICGSESEAATDGTDGHGWAEMRQLSFRRERSDPRPDAQKAPKPISVPICDIRGFPSPQKQRRGPEKPAAVEG